MENYEDKSTKELVNIWKGIREGDSKLAEKALIARIETDGKDKQEGPAKVAYLHNGKLKWTFLTPFQTCKEPCVAYDVGIYD